MGSKSTIFNFEEKETLSLLAFLRKQFPEYSSRDIKRIIDRGGCYLNGICERFSSTKLKKGDQITCDITKVQKLRIESIPILYEDKSFLVIDKPPGITATTVALQPFFKEEIFIVHRLDKETSGALILAKSRAIQKKFENLFRRREVSKTYFALVLGEVQKSEGTIDSYLAKKTKYSGQTIWCSAKKGHHAITHWKLVKTIKNLSLLRLRPTTGRTHQLRVHLTEMGHPILGDHQYARKSRFPRGIHRILLHASALSFIHPESSKKINITSKLPDDFNSIINP